MEGVERRRAGGRKGVGTGEVGIGRRRKGGEFRVRKAE